MREIVLGAVLGTLGACSVPALSLDGKECPCTDGYVCDTLTNRCLMTNDGGTIIDTPAATGCLASLGAETETYRYGGNFDWATQGGTWSGSTTEIVQSDKMAGTIAYRTSVDLKLANMHVLATMRETAQGNGGTPAIGIVMRAALDGSSHYACVWSSALRTLAVERVDGGGTTLVGTAATIPTTTTVPASFTMEAAVTGSTLGCCIREVAQARVTGATDTVLTMGYPGLETSRRAAAFGSFVVFKLP